MRSHSRIGACTMTGGKCGDTKEGRKSCNNLDLARHERASKGATKPMDNSPAHSGSHFINERERFANLAFKGEISS